MSAKAFLFGSRDSVHASIGSDAMVTCSSANDYYTQHLDCSTHAAFFLKRGDRNQMIGLSKLHPFKINYGGLNIINTPQKSKKLNENCSSHHERISEKSLYGEENK